MKAAARQPLAIPGLPEGFSVVKLLTRLGNTKGFEVVLHGRVVCVLGKRAAFPDLERACRAFEGATFASPEA